MLLIHVLALLALLPRFWSWTAVAVLLVLDWLTACVGVTLGYHHLHSDGEADHHNSHLGFWWSHFGWMLRDVPAQRFVRALTPDLQSVAYYRWLNRNVLLLQLPPAAGARLPRHLAGEFRHPSLGVCESSQW